MFIDSRNSPLDGHITRRTWEWFEQFWSGDEILKNIRPIRRLARKVPRSRFTGTGLVAASARLEKAGIPAAYLLSDTAREYEGFTKFDQLITTLASRVGNAQVAPTPRIWPMLALALFEWRNTLPASDVMAHAALAEVVEETQRGLLITSFLFPELRGWLSGVQMEIPSWEKVIAVPLAARKLVVLEERQ